MSAKSATLLTVLMLSAILFMAVGLFSVTSDGTAIASDGYGVSAIHR